MVDVALNICKESTLWWEPGSGLVLVLAHLFVQNWSAHTGVECMQGASSNDSHGVLCCGVWDGRVQDHLACMSYV